MGVLGFSRGEASGSEFGVGFRVYFGVWGHVPDGTTSSRLSRFLLSSATAVMTLASLDNNQKRSRIITTIFFAQVWVEFDAPLITTIVIVTRITHDDSGLTGFGYGRLDFRQFHKCYGSY